MLDKQFYVKNALIYGAVSIAYLMISYSVGVDYMVSFVNTGISFVIPTAVLVFIGIQLRKEMGGFMKFSEAILPLFITYLLGSFLLLAFNHVLNTVIDPDLPYKTLEVVTEKTMAMMEGFGVPDEALDETMKGFEIAKDEAMANFTLFGFIKTYAFSAVFGLIYVLIAGAISQKKNPNPLDQVEN